ncbi:hypothetical protein [Aliiruegeria sabulilitoris]|uniref:hypothetical protein n=1 Tax=Aliiruegeria sabulilitoris TaxID=1510458 RepID=UPI000830F00F|nr:hypothetical protein [Aliiruegeria sabulilitoris]NDR59195.1 hypothetical protein [Pseudoruegeria sp. M32A2M]
MGGMGSGRHWHIGARSTTEDYRAIDVRWLGREGMMRPGYSGNITWSRNGGVVASVGIASEPGRIVLDYRSRSVGEDWESLRYSVHLDATPCNIGGARHWFLCPAQGCGRRVAVLYGGRIYACRHCHQLAYPSQREDAGERAARKADRIRGQLGWKPGILNGPELCNKPKGMHWRTFERLNHHHDRFVMQALGGIAAKFGFADRLPSARNRPK